MLFLHLKNVDFTLPKNVDLKLLITRESRQAIPAAVQKAHNTAERAQTIPKEKDLSPIELFEKYSPAVFLIRTSTGNELFQGSGFFISKDGMALSNYHVFKGTKIGLETIVLSDGSELKIKNIIHKSEENDLILFMVNINHNVKHITISNSIPKVGEKIYAIGSPRGLENTLSEGLISQIRDKGKILQINAPIDHGSSGGVLMNSRGEAVGITSGGLDESGANLNFAININLIKPYITE